MQLAPQIDTERVRARGPPQPTHTTLTAARAGATIPCCHSREDVNVASPALDAVVAALNVALVEKGAEDVHGVLHLVVAKTL